MKLPLFAIIALCAALIGLPHKCPYCDGAGKAYGRGK